MTAPPASLRILASCHNWQGATDYGFIRAFRRAGHSVLNLPDTDYTPAGWRARPLRLLRRLTLPLMAADYQRALIEAAAAMRPHLFFVYKGTLVDADTVDAIRRLGAVAINVYPDVSFTVHGRYIPRALPRYDWVLTTKSYGVADLARELGVDRASYLPHGFDPETHAPMALDASDEAAYGCDAAFIGTWSPKKEALLLGLKQRLPSLSLKIWGNQWEHARELRQSIVGGPVVSREYAKAIASAAINIAILKERHGEASSGDLSTTRTFEIPAVGGFMLHERTEETQGFFEEGKDCAMFETADELAQKTAWFLAHPDARRAIAQAGHARCLESGYSLDHRAAAVIAKARELMAQR